MNAAQLRDLTVLIALGGVTLACQGDPSGGTESGTGASTTANSTTGDDSTATGTSATTGTTDATGTGATTSASTTGDEPTTTTAGTTAEMTATTEPETSETSSGGPVCVDWTPWFHDGFDTYAPGTSLSGEQPFGAAGRTVATDEVQFAGTGAARMEIRPEDKGGFGKWGGIVPLPDLEAGRSVWVRLWVRWPATFEFSAEPWMKFLRLHNRTADDENGGYNDLYVDNADGEKSVLRVIKEIHDKWEVYDGPSLPRDTWERYEFQLVIDHVPVDDGGEGRFRVWRDDELIFDRTDVPTISGPGGVIDGLFIFTYWNNEMPPNNVAFIDELTIAFDDTPPPEVDGLGNPRIGGWLPCSDR